MKTALITAIVAAVAATGSAEAGQRWINGKSIKPHSIALSRLDESEVLGPSIQIAARDYGFAIAECKNGGIAASGGFTSASSTGTPEPVEVTAIGSDGFAWGARIYNPNTTTITVQARARCIAQ